jgi:serine/threonine protein kinase
MASRRKPRMQPRREGISLSAKATAAPNMVQSISTESASRAAIPMQPLSAIPGFEPTQRYTAAQHNALPPGTHVNDYEIVRVLGEGGFSVVYLAEDRTLERRVAIKEYLPVSLAMRGEGAEVTLRTGAHADTFAQGLVSFINEARLLARFDHPSLVRVHHFWKANGTAYMVMPYIEGSTLLASRRAMAGPPDETWLRELVSSLLGALEVLHEASCYHRDIAPDNILILHDGRPLLLDFGAARHVIGERTQQLTAILKPAFAPIEQYAEATHLQQGPWTDLYALGAVVRFCITGHSPMPSTVRAMHDDMESLANEVRALALEYPGLHYSAPFLTAIDWALAVRPADRPQSVQEFREALSRPFVMPAVRAPAQTVAPPAVPDTPAVSAPETKAAAPAAPHVEVQVPLSEEERAEAAVKRLLDSVDAPAKDDAPFMVDEPWIASRPAPKLKPKPPRSTARQAVLFGLAAAAVGALGAATWLWSEERQHANAAIAKAAISAAATNPGASPATSAGSAGMPATPMPAPAPVPAPEPATATATVSAAAPVAVPPAAVTPSVATTPPTTAAPPPASVAAPAAPVPPTAAAPAPAPAPQTTPAAKAQSATSRVADASGARAGSRTRPAARAEPDNPRAMCGSRQQFALYYCMQTQCQNTRYYAHPQCVDFRRRDEVE